MFTSPIKKTTKEDDAGVYVHFPYCLQKCPYCDFNSHVPKRGESYAPYTAAILRELDARLGELAGRRLTSIFFGGGTPSLWAPGDVAKVIEKICAALHAHAPDLEITLEANPGAVERGRLDEFKGAGINRVSMGVQALDDKLLRQLGRIHDRKEALDALALIQQTGFASHSIDLIYSVPGQTLAAWQATMAEIVSLATPHVSAYTLTYEPGTRMTEWRDTGVLKATPEDDEAAMFEATFRDFYGGRPRSLRSVEFCARGARLDSQPALLALPTLSRCRRWGPQLHRWRASRGCQSAGQLRRRLERWRACAVSVRIRRNHRAASARARTVVVRPENAARF